MASDTEASDRSCAIEHSNGHPGNLKLFTTIKMIE